MAKLATETRFAIVPVWLLRDENLTSDAKALYGILMSYANNDTLAAFPSRETLAKHLSGKTTKSVDRAVKALTDVGALTTTRRWRNKRGDTATVKSAEFSEPTSTLYTLRQSEPEGRDTDVATLETRVSRRSDTDVPLTRPNDLDLSELDIKSNSDKSQTRKHHRNKYGARPGEDTTSRVIRLVAYALDTTLSQAEEHLEDEYGFDDGSGDTTSLVGTIRAHCHGRNWLYPAMSDTSLMDAIDRARDDENVDYLYEYTTV